MLASGDFGTIRSRFQYDIAGDFNLMAKQITSLFMTRVYMLRYKSLFILSSFIETLTKSHTNHEQIAADWSASAQQKSQQKSHEKSPM